MNGPFHVLCCCGVAAEIEAQGPSRYLGSTTYCSTIAAPNGKRGQFSVFYSGYVDDDGEKIK